MAPVPNRLTEHLPVMESRPGSWIPGARRRRPFPGQIGVFSGRILIRGRIGFVNRRARIATAEVN
jgi:hypothetical protein